jgi:DMSO/TMAO reductase YedYZ molybdopterin-dependent catalytic subunit
LADLIVVAHMTRSLRQKVGRRELSKGSLASGGTFLFGFDKSAWQEILQDTDKNPLASGRKVGEINFSKEVAIPFESPFGAGLDSRVYTDLSKLTPETSITPTQDFYIRTRASELIETAKPWTIRLGGLGVMPVQLGIDELMKSAKSMGLYLMECAGNERSIHFGLMSAAEWAGVPLLDVLKRANANAQPGRILVSGFDTYPTKSVSSQSGASWVFSWDELKSTRAFLATEMNRKPLTKNHGAPIRLIVPGWYGCACIKWVNEITLVDETAEATSQMQEFAGRTGQQGVPKLARDYKPATIAQAAMPTRVEKWLVNDRID